MDSVHYEKQEHQKRSCIKKKKYNDGKKLPQKCIRTLSFAFVYPHLLNGIEICANTGSTHKDKVPKVNNKILRAVQNKPHNSPVFDLYKL